MTSTRLRWRRNGEGGDTLGPGGARRGADAGPARGRQALRVGRAAARGERRRAARALRVHDRRLRAAWAGDAAGARPRAAARRARRAARVVGGARAQAAVNRRARAESTREPRINAPSVEPEPTSGSTACSGCGIIPKTLPCSLHTPAIEATEPFGFRS